MSNAFTHYWQNDTWSDAAEHRGEDLDHTAGNEFRKRGVRRGDMIYIVTVIEGKLYLCVRLRADHIVGQKEAERLLNADLWKASEHVVCGSPGQLRFDIQVPNDVVRQLRFGDDAVAPKFSAPEMLDKQTMRGVRMLTPDSAQMLDRVLNAHRAKGPVPERNDGSLEALVRKKSRNTKMPPLEVVENRADIEASLDTFQAEAQVHPERTQKILRSTKYWVYDNDSGTFGPGKFVGYRAMDFDRYEQVRNEWPGGARFDGHISKTHIERALETSFEENSTLREKCLDWGIRLLGNEAFGGADVSKWRFVQLPARGRVAKQEAKEAIDAAEIQRARGQGFRISREARKAIEDYAMKRAIEHFERLEYAVEDVHKHSSCDLICTKNQESLYVEIKGTQTAGEEILLTPNEVALARAKHPQTVLYVLRDVQVIEGAGGIKVKAGTPRLIQPWKPPENALIPIGYTCLLGRE